jgi:hypothetical protein
MYNTIQSELRVGRKTEEGQLTRVEGNRITHLMSRTIRFEEYPELFRLRRNP